MPISISMLCRVYFYLLASTMQDSPRVYTFTRSPFISGNDVDLHYFSADDVATLNSTYADWLGFLNLFDYHNNYDTSAIPDYSSGFRSPCAGRYTFSDGLFLTVVEDLY